MCVEAATRSFQWLWHDKKWEKIASGVKYGKRVRGEVASLVMEST